MRHQGIDVLDYETLVSPKTHRGMIGFFTGAVCIISGGPHFVEATRSSEPFLGVRSVSSASL